MLRIKKIPFMRTLFIAIAVFVMLGLLPTAEAATQRYVATTGTDAGVCSIPATPCKTITYAITQSVPGDTINVAAGAYSENVNVNKSLTLTGASSPTVTVTAANPAASVFNVTVNNVNISGFTLSGATGGGQAGIFLGAGVANCDIHDNVLTGSFDGIWLGAGSNHNTLTNNMANSNTTQGFEVYISSYNTFTDNIANSNTKYGFKIDSGDHNTFTGNTANSNLDKGFYSVEGDGGGSTNSTFTNNTANLNTRHGLHLIGSNDHVTLTGNTFDRNGQTGIKLQNVVTNLSMQNNNITNNPTGINISGENSPDIPDVSTWTVTYNNIAGNAVGVSNAGTGILNAENNWWGDATGPYDGAGTNGVPPCTSNPATEINADGEGDSVSDNVDYCPWLLDFIEPDLVVFSLTATPSTVGTGTVVSVKDTTRNNGPGWAGESTTSFYLSTDTTLNISGDTFLGNRSVPALAAGENSTATTSVTIPAVSAGTWYIIANADADNPPLVLSTKNADSTALWATTPVKSGYYSASLDSGSVTAGEGDEARIRITMPPGTTLNDITSISWWEYNVAGYPPHVDIKVDKDGNGVEDDALVIEYAYNGHIGETPMPYGALTGAWYQTFSDDTLGPSVIGDTAFAWLSSGPPGPLGDPAFKSGTLAQWKAGSGGNVDPTVNGSTAVTALEIEVDNWVVNSNAYVDDIAINGVIQYGNAESDETNNTKATPVILVGPDLIVSALFAPTSAEADSDIDVKDVTKNNGGGDAGASTTKFYLSTDTILDDLDYEFLVSRSVPALAAGVSSIATTSVHIPIGTAGKYYIIAKADATGAVAETDEDNNTRSTYRPVLIGADLYISALTATVGATTITIADTTTNKGLGDAGASKTRFYLSTNMTLNIPGDTEIGIRNIGALAAGESSAGTTTPWPIGTTPAGIYYIIAKADDGSTVPVAETNENNNTRFTRIVITGGPDLVVSSLTFAGTPRAGAAINVTDTTANTGSAAALVGSRTRFYLSTDNTFGPGDTLLNPLTGRSVPALAATTGSSTGTTTVTIPLGTTPGSYYIIARADATGQVAEWNATSTGETNNTTATAITVVP